MAYFQNLLRRIWNDESGGLSAEYSALIVFIAILAIGGMVILGPNIAFYFEAAATQVPDAAADPPNPLGT